MAYALKCAKYERPIVLYELNVFLLKKQCKHSIIPQSFYCSATAAPTPFYPLPRAYSPFYIFQT